MPNWTFNKLTVTGDQDAVKKFVAEHVVETEDEQRFDFNTFVKMPDELRVESGSITYLAKTTNDATFSHELLGSHPELAFEDGGVSIGLKSRQWADQRETALKAGADPAVVIQRFKERLPERWAMIEQIRSNIVKFGHSDWYSWSVQHWGTKWNASDTMVEDVIDGVAISFNTAWCKPDPIQDAIVARYSGKGLDIEWFHHDEDERFGSSEHLDISEMEAED